MSNRSCWRELAWPLGFLPAGLLGTASGGLLAGSISGAGAALPPELQRGLLLVLLQGRRCHGSDIRQCLSQGTGYHK